MANKRIILLIVAATVSAVFLVGFQTILRLRRELAAAREENGRLQQAVLTSTEQNAPSSRAGSKANETVSEEQQKHAQQLESEVMRLRGVASRALRAEAEAAQFKAQLEGRQSAPPTGIGDSTSAAKPFLTYLGGSVPAPP